MKKIPPDHILNHFRLTYLHMYEHRDRSKLSERQPAVSISITCHWHELKYHFFLETLRLITNSNFVSFWKFSDASDRNYDSKTVSEVLSFFFVNEGAVCENGESHGVMCAVCSAVRSDTGRQRTEGPKSITLHCQLT
jgi:hypothetical protein